MGVNMSEEKKTVNAKPTGLTEGAAKLPLILIVVLAACLIFVWIQGYRTASRLDELSKKLTAESEAVRADVSRLDKDLSALSAKVETIAGAATKLSESLTNVEKALGRNVVETQEKLEQLKAEQGKTIAQVSDGVGVVTEDLRVLKEASESERSRMQKKLGLVNDDFNYIKEELGKKAEKSYLKFLKRDLMSEITGVSENLETYKTEVEGKFQAADQKIQVLGDTIETKISDKVKQASRLDFVASEDEAKAQKAPAQPEAPAAEAAPAPAAEPEPQHKKLPELEDVE